MDPTRAARGRHFLISGLVQGVGFRIAALREAERLKLSGWVRNLGDGRVEAEAHGDPEALESLRRWLARGPTLARVTHVQEKDIAPGARTPSGFVTKPTAQKPSR